jgi:hypothetical protein
VINQVLLNCHPKKFRIAVTMETASIRTSVRPEKTNAERICNS